MPAVVTVMEGINLPRYPSVPGRMRAKRKPIAASQPARAEAKLKMVRLVLPEASSKQVEILGSGPEAAPRVSRSCKRSGCVDGRDAGARREPPRTSSPSRRW